MVHHSFEFGFHEQKFTQKSGVSLLNFLSFFEHFVNLSRWNWVDLTLIDGFAELLACTFLLVLKDLNEIVQLGLILDLEEIFKGSFDGLEMTLPVVILLGLEGLLIDLGVLVVLELLLLGLVGLAAAEIHDC